MKLKSNYKPSLLGFQAALVDATLATNAAVQVSLEGGPEADMIAAKLIERALRYAHTYDRQYFSEEES